MTERVKQDFENAVSAAEVSVVEILADYTNSSISIFRLDVASCDLSGSPALRLGQFCGP